MLIFNRNDSLYTIRKKWLMPRAPDPEFEGSYPTRVKPCCVLEQGAFTPKKTGNTQEAVAPSEHDLKIVCRDVKNQSTNQPSEKVLRLEIIMLPGRESI